MKITYALLLFCITIYAQKSVKVTYEQVTTFREGFFDAIPENEREQTKKLMTSPLVFELYNNDDLSLFKSADVADINFPSTSVPEIGVENRGTIFKMPSIWILKNYEQRKTFNKSVVFDITYYVENEFRVEEFIFTNEVQIIEKNKCKMAYMLPKNRLNDTIKYWYADGIPISDGPYYTVGIPGLVLKYERKNRIIYATKIEFFDKKINIEGLDKSISTISEGEHKSLKENANKPQSYTDEKGTKVTTGSLKITN
jgi:GLPGLI family protein